MIGDLTFFFRDPLHRDLFIPICTVNHHLRDRLCCRVYILALRCFQESKLFLQLAIRIFRRIHTSTSPISHIPQHISYGRRGIHSVYARHSFSRSLFIRSRYLPIWYCASHGVQSCLAIYIRTRTETCLYSALSSRRWFGDGCGYLFE